jgi:hypothetical protein
MTLEEMISHVSSSYNQKFTLLQNFVKKGYDVIVVSDPPIQHAFVDTRDLVFLFELYENALSKILSNYGISFFCARNYFNNDTFPDYYYSPNEEDWIHASQDYYDEIALALSVRFGIKLNFSLSDLPEDMKNVVNRVIAYIGKDSFL